MGAPGRGDTGDVRVLVAILVAHDPAHWHLRPLHRRSALVHLASHLRVALLLLGAIAPAAPDGGGEHGVGRLDIVENRYVGMKSRGCYETPGGTILLRAHRAIESLTLDREVAHLKDELMPRYAKMIYNGYWWAPERVMLQTAIDETQRVVNGDVRIRLYKGNVTVTGRRSRDSLFDDAIATFEDDAGKYDQGDAEGFIKLNALRLRIAAEKGRSILGD